MKENNYEIDEIIFKKFNIFEFYYNRIWFNCLYGFSKLYENDIECICTKYMSSGEKRSIERCCKCGAFKFYDRKDIGFAYAYTGTECAKKINETKYAFCDSLQIGITV